jgi:hypothetical protein
MKSLEQWIEHDDPVIREAAKRAADYKAKRDATPPELSEDQFQGLMLQLGAVLSSEDAAAGAEVRKARAEFLEVLKVIAGFVL